MLLYPSRKCSRMTLSPAQPRSVRPLFGGLDGVSRGSGACPPGADKGAVFKCSRLKILQIPCVRPFTRKKKVHRRYCKYYSYRANLCRGDILRIIKASLQCCEFPAFEQLCFWLTSAACCVPPCSHCVALLCRFLSSSVISIIYLLRPLLGEW